MKPFHRFFLLTGLGLLAGCQGGPATEPRHTATTAASWSARNPVWRGLHLLLNSDSDLITLQAQLPRLAGAGVNTLILEVNYNFVFQSHPELGAPAGIRPEHARQFTAAARQLGLRVIPQLNCIGHQSWAHKTYTLLTVHPEFDETPGQFPENKDIYCRSWCPQHPGVNPIIFALIDELAAAFEADAFHVGMDEVFLIASAHCPRCRGGDPAALFARAVTDLHRHIVGGRHLEMLMWGDRLLDAQAMHGGEWEYARNGTAPAAALIPKDIIVCDWHYEKQADYPSVPFLLSQGFRVWPASWQPLEGARAFSSFARQQHDPKLVGFLCTVWGRVKLEDVAAWPPVAEVLAGWK